MLRTEDYIRPWKQLYWYSIKPSVAWDSKTGSSLAVLAVCLHLLEQFCATCSSASFSAGEMRLSQKAARTVMIHAAVGCLGPRTEIEMSALFS